MKVMIIAFILMSIMGCRSKYEEFEIDKTLYENVRFEIIYFATQEENPSFIVMIILDKNTDIEYLFVKRSNGAGLCPLLKKEIYE